MARTILETIVANKKASLKDRFSKERLHFFEEKIANAKNSRDFYSVVSHGPKWSIIAEIKAKSPSKGVLLSHPDPSYWANLYERSGASAISIVTEENYFNGNIDWIEQVKNASNLPVVRKDFLTNVVELAETRAMGADAVLLIAAILTPEELSELVDEALLLGMEPLVEVHTEEEARHALLTRARIIGVNNRNLKDFSIDLETTKALLPLLEGRFVVSESGIGSLENIEMLHGLGVRAFLIGETFLTSENPEAIVEKFSAKHRKVEH